MFYSNNTPFRVGYVPTKAERPVVKSDRSPEESVGLPPVFERYADVVTVPELAEMLRIGRNAAYELARSGIIPSVKIGKSIRIPKSAVIEYLTRGGECA
jgi:excisionase family DNA binding protein